MKITITCIIVLCVIFMSIGYSALNADLTITGNAFVQVNGEIEVTSIYTKNSINDASALYMLY